MEIQACNSKLFQTFPNIFEDELQFSFDEGKTYQSLEITLPLLCPRCGSREITKQGMDYSLQTPKQRYGCKKCDKRFYSNTSGVMQENLLIFYQDLLQSRYEDGERIRTIAKRHGLSESTISKEIKWIKNRVVNALQELPWKPPLSEIFYVDEKFVKICGKKKLLIIVSNDEGVILAHRLSKNRNSDTIKKVIKKGIKINGKCPRVLVTDGFSSYTKVVRRLSFDVIHVRHIHKPPYKRITIEFKELNEHGDPVLVTLYCTNELFVEPGAHYGIVKTRLSNKHEKSSKKKRKPYKNKKIKLIEMLVNLFLGIPKKK